MAWLRLRETGCFPAFITKNRECCHVLVRRIRCSRLAVSCQTFCLVALRLGFSRASRSGLEHGMTDSPSAQTFDLDELFRQHSRELWAIFYSQCSNSERAYDAVQESFLRIHSYQGETIRDPRAWLLRVGQNWLRDVARRKSSSTRLTPSLDEMAPQPDTVNNLLMAEESRDTIRAALSEMIEDDRKVLVMKYALSWSSAQMAKVMDCTAAAIDMRLSRARRRLAELLEEQGFGND